MGYRVINGQVHTFEDISQTNVKEKHETQNLNSFQEILENNINKKQQFVISNHAAERLKDRNINFTEADMKAINEGINKASEKGSKDSLLLYKDVALVTSIKNRTIVTAMDKDSSKGNVFTNIDSVVLL